MQLGSHRTWVWEQIFAKVCPKPEPLWSLLVPPVRFPPTFPQPFADNQQRTITINNYNQEGKSQSTIRSHKETINNQSDSLRALRFSPKWYFIYTWAGSLGKHTNTDYCLKPANISSTSAHFYSEMEMECMVRYILCGNHWKGDEFFCLRHSKSCVDKTSNVAAGYIEENTQKWNWTDHNCPFPLRCISIMCWSKGSNCQISSVPLVEKGEPNLASKLPKNPTYEKWWKWS